MLLNDTIENNRTYNKKVLGTSIFLRKGSKKGLHISFSVKGYDATLLFVCSRLNFKYHCTSSYRLLLTINLFCDTFFSALRLSTCFV